ncbi:6134_t:CDS:1, partial [Rhizophagus irregularis]
DNTMVRKTRNDKKDTICKRCGHECSTLQKLCEHLKRKNPCRPKTDTPIQAPIQVIQEVNQQSVQEANQELPTQTPNKDTKDNEQRKKQDKGKNRRREKPKEVIPTSETSSRKEDTYKGKQFISQEKADRWVNPNARKLGEHYKLWGARLYKRWVQDLGLGD